MSKPKSADEMPERFRAAIAALAAILTSAPTPANAGHALWLRIAAAAASGESTRKEAREMMLSATPEERTDALTISSMVAQLFIQIDKVCGLTVQELGELPSEGCGEPDCLTCNPQSALANAMSALVGIIQDIAEDGDDAVLDEGESEGHNPMADLEKALAKMGDKRPRLNPKKLPH